MSVMIHLLDYSILPPANRDIAIVELLKDYRKEKSLSGFVYPTNEEHIYAASTYYCETQGIELFSKNFKVLKDLNKFYNRLRAINRKKSEDSNYIQLKETIHPVLSENIYRLKLGINLEKIIYEL